MENVENVELEKELEILRAAENILRKKLGKIFNFGGSCKDLLKEISEIEWELSDRRMRRMAQKK